MSVFETLAQITKPVQSTNIYKDKAYEIMDKYRKAGYINDNEIKEMSLIAVELVLNEWNEEHGRKAKQLYWNNVKNELINLTD